MKNFTQKEFVEYCEKARSELDAQSETIVGYATGICIHGRQELTVNDTLTVNWLAHTLDPTMDNTGYGLYKLVKEIDANAIVHDSKGEVVVNLTNTMVKGLLVCLAETTLSETYMSLELINNYLESEHFEEFAAENTIRYRMVLMKNITLPVETTEGGYFKLEALSTDKVILRKDAINLDGLFGNLKRVGWVGNSPIELDWLEDNKMDLVAANRYPALDSIDFLPRMIHKVVPNDRVRVLDSSKVRYGAQLAAGTVVMPGASYVNFNAGTLGAVMNEGRISSSAVVGAGSDVGGGASILGVLSGTDGYPITIGENVLLGANSVTGISLGDGCIVDAGIAILPGTKISMSLKDRSAIAEINSADIFDLAGYHVDTDGTAYHKCKNLGTLKGIHYRMDTSTGNMIAKRSSKEIKLNENLH